MMNERTQYTGTTHSLYIINGKKLIVLSKTFPDHSTYFTSERTSSRVILDTVKLIDPSAQGPYFFDCTTSTLQPAWISHSDWIVANVRIRIDAAFESDRIALNVTTNGRIKIPRHVVV